MLITFIITFLANYNLVAYHDSIVFYWLLQINFLLLTSYNLESEVATVYCSFVDGSPIFGRKGFLKYKYVCAITLNYRYFLDI